MKNIFAISRDFSRILTISSCLEKQARLFSHYQEERSSASSNRVKHSGYNEKLKKWDALDAFPGNLFRALSFVSFQVKEFRWETTRNFDCNGLQGRG